MAPGGRIGIQSSEGRLMVLVDLILAHSEGRLILKPGVKPHECGSDVSRQICYRHTKQCARTCSAYRFMFTARDSEAGAQRYYMFVCLWLHGEDLALV